MLYQDLIILLRQIWSSQQWITVTTKSLETETSVKPNVPKNVSFLSHFRCIVPKSHANSVKAFHVKSACFCIIEIDSFVESKYF